MLVLWLWLALGGPAVEIRTRPVITTREAVYLTVFVRPEPENRQMVVRIASETYERSSYYPLQGAEGPRQIRIQWYSVPEGEYDIEAFIGDARGRELHRGHARVTVW